MEYIPSFNNDNADEHYDNKATNTNQVGDYNCCITLNIQQLTKSFNAALLRCCKQTKFHDNSPTIQLTNDNH